MLTQVSLQNFKCFSNLALPLAPFTLLTGFNAAGKSTVLQSLLLIVQALRADYHARLIDLNGSLVKLGTTGEVLRRDSSAVEIQIGFSSNEVDLGWTLSLDPNSSNLKHKNYLKIVSFHQGKIKKNITASLALSNLMPKKQSDQHASKLVLSLKETIFISAVRKTELDVLPSPEQTPIDGNVGIYGEFAPWFFQEYSDDEIPKEKRHPTAENEVTLRTQYRAWGGSIFPGTDGNAARLSPRSGLIELGLRVDKGEYCRPSNIGYGISYAFPIIIAGLLAKPGQILIVDSPEAHLHPKGQSQMGRFLAHMAQAGVQVIIETHSDHLLNGLRLAVKEQAITPENVAIHFFRNSDPVDGRGSSRVVSPVVDSTGALDHWPEGFFDQSEKDMARLMGWQ
jgi:predicted ATPase